MERTNVIFKRSLWRFRWYGLLTAALVALVGVTTITIQPDRYRAHARVEIIAGALNQLFSEGNTTEAQSVSAETLWAKKILSRDQLSEVVQTARLRNDGNVSTNEVLSRIIIEGNSRWQNLFGITYTDSDRDRALAVVQALVAVLESEAKQETPVAAGTRGGDSVSNNFRIINEPESDPISTPEARGLWLALIWIASISAGYGTVVWWDRRNSVYDLPEQLAADEIPLIGAIAHTKSRQIQLQRRRQVRIFAAGLASFLVAGAIVMAVLDG